MAAGRIKSADIVVYGVPDIQRITGLGRPNALRLAKLIGRRVGRRLLVARSALERWLTAGDDAAPEKARRIARRVKPKTES